MKSLYYFVISIWLIFVSLSSAQIPQQINYQGILSDISGNPVTGTYTINFSIYADGTTTSSIWMETQSVTVNNGLFNVQLGFNNPIPIYIFDGSDKYLGIQIGSDPEMLPRQKLTSVGYSFKAADATTLNGLPSSSFADASHHHNSVYYTKTELNTDDGTPNQTEDPVSWNKIKDIPVGLADGVDDAGSSTSGIIQIDGGTGLTVTNPTGPTATIDLNINQDDGTPNQIEDPVSWSKIKDIPAGFADGTDNGILDITVGGGLSITNPTGPYVAINLPLKNDLFTDDGAPNQLSDLVSWNKLKDVPGAFADGTDDGLAPHSHFGDIWIGNSWEAGLKVENNTGSAIDAEGTYGVHAMGISAGIMGVGLSGGLAADFRGDVMVYGNLTESGGAFRIDHPLDPANKFLQHSFVESSDMMNIYSGNVILNSNGEAAIELPDWFEALNKDFRYQLTCIGGYAQVYIAKKISNNRFKIAGGTSGLEVSWQVTGIRKDAYAVAHPIEVEVDKPSNEKGKYIFPELFGASEEAGINYEQYKKMEEMKKSSVIK